MDLCWGSVATSIIVVVVTFAIVKYFLAGFKVDRGSKRHGGEIVAEVLRAHGVDFIFTLCGGHISPILVASERLGIKVIDTRHEANAVFAADAMARVGGRIGVAAVTAGPGVTNTVTAVKNAQMAESPVLIIGGAAATLLKGRGALQDINQVSLFTSVCKHVVTIKRVKDIAPSLKKAIHIACSGTPGPVFVEFPINILYQYELVAREIGVKDRVNGFIPKIVNWYIRRSVDKIFDEAWAPHDTTPIPPWYPLSSSTEVRKIASFLSTSSRPVIVLGSQVMLPPMSACDLAKAVQRLGIPCFLGGMARGLLGARSKLVFRHHRKEALQEADFIILAGSVCDFRLSYGRALSKNAKIVSINRNREQLYKNSDLFWKLSIAIQADPASVLVQLSSLSDLKEWPEWFSLLNQREDSKESQNRQKSTEHPLHGLNPMGVLYNLESCLGDNAVLVADGGDFVGTAAYILKPRGPLQWLDPGAFGTLGVGGGFALGVKLARPESEVWIIYGDGACGFSIMELDTMVRMKVPVIAVIGNDACWSQIARDQVPILGSSVACSLRSTDYHLVAEGLGAKGFVVDDKMSNEDIQAVFREAKFLVTQGFPVVINALIGVSKFREGSISV